MIANMAFKLSGAGRIDPSIGAEDLVSIGRWEALRRLPEWRPGRASLKTFLSRRVRGSMLDEIRRTFPLSRSHYAEQAANGGARRVASLDCFLNPSDGRQRDVPERPGAERPDDAAATDDFWRRVTRGLLPDERRIVLGYFRRGLTLACAGAEVDRSEPRAHQVLAAALARMRTTLRNERPEDLLPVDRRRA